MAVTKRPRSKEGNPGRDQEKLDCVDEFEAVNFNFDFESIDFKSFTFNFKFEAVDNFDLESIDFTSFTFDFEFKAVDINFDFELFDFDSILSPSELIC